jgi:hypothetical protein
MSRVLPTSGQISAIDINSVMSVLPADKGSTDTVSLDDDVAGKSVRMMFNKSSGAISFQDGHGKAYCTIYALDQPDCYIYTGDVADDMYGITMCNGGSDTVSFSELENYCLSEDPGGLSAESGRCGEAKFDVVFCDGTVVNDRIVGSLENNLCFRADPTAIAADFVPDTAGEQYGLGTSSGGTSTQCYSEGT